MAYFLDLFSPETFEAFCRSGQDISGFRQRHLNTAKKVHPGDIFVCYMTKLSRWIGLLEVASDCFIDQSPLFFTENDPFVVRFKVKPLVWLPKEKLVPIHDTRVWDSLSFTKGHNKKSPSWTGKIRSSLVKLDDADGRLLEEILREQAENGKTYDLDLVAYQKHATQRVRRPDKVVTVKVPEKEKGKSEKEFYRESARLQGLLARIGEEMGFRVWLPRQDRQLVLRIWTPKAELLEHLPLNYDETTLKTIEQIDVLWLKGRSIVRAFEVEHTTAVYSGILRMADLLALQPNMDIKLHIVAPLERRDKVFEEILRPVFSLLEKGPLAEYCTFISYQSLWELSEHKHLAHLSDSVLEEYTEEAE
jgi:predicted RNA-binding protein